MSDTREIVIQAQKDVINAHDLWDWFDEYPWLTGSIGDIHAPVWFLAENPSLSRLEEKAEKGASNENDQWNASAGDRLLRKAITEAGLKTGDPKKNEGWHCYISNVDKQPDIAGKRNAKKKELGKAPYLKQQAGIWYPVLQKQIDLGSPRIIVALGGDADYILRHMRRLGLRAPKSEKIHHYTFIMNRPETTGKKRVQRHPERIKEYKEHIADIARRYA